VQPIDILTVLALYQENVGTLLIPDAGSMEEGEIVYMTILFRIILY